MTTYTITSHEKEQGNHQLRKQFQERIERDKEIFFSSGGKIQVINNGQSGKQSEGSKHHQTKYKLIDANQDLLIKISKRVNELVDQYGSLQKAGQAIGIHGQTLSKLRRKSVKNPGIVVLHRLGLRD